MQNKEYTYEDLSELVRKLRGNEMSVPREVLTTQYAVPYNRLKAQIKNVAEELMMADVFCGFGILPNDADAILPTLQAIIREERKTGGLIHKGSIALFKHYDVNEFKVLVEKLREKMWIAYEPYWAAHFYMCNSSTVMQSYSLI